MKLSCIQSHQTSPKFPASRAQAKQYGNRIAETAADIVGNNSPGVVFMLGSAEAPITANTIVDGFTITAGKTSLLGGGLICAPGSQGQCSPMLRNIAFSGNASSGHGGAIAINSSGGGSSSLTVVNASFSGNQAQAGGAFSAKSSNGSITDIRIYNSTFYAPDKDAFLQFEHIPP